MESNVAFKAYLYKDRSSETHDEVRWFHVDQNAVVSFDLVKQKLISTFPRLEEKEFKLYWKDCDDDLVLISSDTELIIALTNTTSEPRRLYIYLEPSQTAQNKPANVNEVHHVGVVCDGCGGQVYGYRYKCIECPDFDLCARCEANGVHSEHCFLRLTDFTATKRLRKCLSAGRKIFKHCERDPSKHVKRHGGHARHGWYDLLSQFVADMNTSMNDEEPKNDSNTKANAEADNSGKGDAPKNAGARCPFTTSDSNNKEGDCHVNYLKNIGQTIASLLDPLGIDVDVEVRSKNKSEKADTETQKQNDELAASTSKTETNAKSDSTNQTNRAVPVFPPGYVPIYMDTNVHTPVVHAYVNGQKVNGSTSAETANAKPPSANGEPQVKFDVNAFVNGVPVFSTASASSTTTAPPSNTSQTSGPSNSEENAKEKKSEGEGGWTLLDDGESSSSSEDNSTTTESQNAGDGDSTRKQESSKTSEKQNNEQTGPQPTFAGVFTNMPNMGQQGMPGNYPGMHQGFPPMPPHWPGMNQNMPGMGQNMQGMPGMQHGFAAFMPGMPPYQGMPNFAGMGQSFPGMQGQGQNTSPMPGFNFDNMARDLQQHLQTHFKDAMSVASTIASTVAANTVNNMRNSRRPSSANDGSTADSDTLQNIESNTTDVKPK